MARSSIIRPNIEAADALETPSTDPTQIRAGYSCASPNQGLSASAGYQQDLLLYCGEGKDARFGVIEFAVSADVTEEFRKAARAVAEADWQPLYRRASVTRPIRSSPRSASCRPGPATAG